MLPRCMLEGLPPNNATHVMRLTCDAATARQIADIIVETFDPAETAATAFEESTNPPDWIDGPWVVEAYFGQPPDEANVRALVEAVAGDAVADAVSFGRVEPADWVAASLAGLAPVRVGRFLLYGAHDRAVVRANDIAIEIEAALAFGTGHHGSTRGCLAFIDRIGKRRRPHRVLDVGTGTGILAIAAEKLFRVPVMAGDIDPVAVGTAKANARRNGATQIHIVQARGIVGRALQNAAPYDLIIANILATPLRQLAPSLARVLTPGGEIILSGLLGRDVPGVINAYRAQNIALVGRLDIDGWATLLMRRPPSSSPLPIHGERARVRG